MKLSKRIKESRKRRVRLFFYSILRRHRYFRGTSQQFFKLTLDYLLVQLNLNQDIPFLFVAACVGILTGYVAVVFHDSIVTISTLSFTGLRSFGKTTFIDNYWKVLLPFIPAFGGLLVGLYNAFVVKARPGHVLASVIKAVA